MWYNIRRDRDVAQLVARLLWEQDVASSNLVIPTKTKAAEGQLSFCIIQYLIIKISFHTLKSLITLKFIQSYEVRNEE